MFFPFLYFTSKFFCFFFYILLFICPCAISTNFWVEFSFVISKHPVLFVLLDSILVFFESLFFSLISFDLFFLVLLDLSSFVFWGSYHFVGFLWLLIFLSNFICCQSFFIRPSTLIFYPGFVFLFRYIYGMSILLQTSFAPAYRSVRWCCSLGYISIIHLLFRFLPLLLSSLYSLGTVM